MPTVAERIVVRERIAPEITSSLFANYRSASEAVLELVDNAVDSRLRTRPLEVALSIRPGTLTVSTTGGEGMGPRDIERYYLRWGSSSKRGRMLLGQYGQGGKAAIGHLGQRFSIEASRPGDEVVWRFSDPEYRDRSRLKTYELVAAAKRVEAGTGFVRIRVEGVDKRVDERRIQHRLAEVYRPLLETGALRLTVNAALVAPVVLPALERDDFRVNAARGRIAGWIGVVDPERRPSDFTPGIRCYKLGRLVVMGEFFGHPGPAQEPGMSRLIGEVDIPNVPLTMNKSDFDRDGAAWIAVEDRMHRVLAPWTRRLARDGGAPPPASALKVAEQVRRLLSQALRLADRPELFSGDLGSLGPAPAKGIGESELPLELPAKEKRSEPRPPREREPRPRGFGRIVIRPLDPSVRSQLVVEEGVTVVVINSRYPMFEERRGDIWYQLETAAREICATIEGASLGEYERRVSEIIVTAFKLRARRRRRRPTGRQLDLM